MKSNTLIMATLLMCLVAFSCSQEDQVLPTDDEVEAISVAELPTAAQQYISTNYSLNDVSSAYRVSTSGITVFEAEIGADVNLRFEADGSFIGNGSIRKRPGRGHHGHGPKGEEISLDETPQALQDYLNTNYPDASTGKVLLFTLSDGTTGYGVHVVDVGLLLFDEEGAFVEVREMDGRHGNNGPRPELAEVAIEELPTSVTDYISANYEADIEAAGIATLPDSSTHYVVRLVDGPILIFDADGAFIDEHTPGDHGHHGPHPPLTEIDAADLPAGILTYVETSYPDSVIDKAGTVTSPDGSIHYLVKLDTGEHLHFDEGGNLLD